MHGPCLLAASRRTIVRGGMQDTQASQQASHPQQEGPSSCEVTEQRRCPVHPASSTLGLQARHSRVSNGRQDGSTRLAHETMCTARNTHVTLRDTNGSEEKLYRPASSFWAQRVHTEYRVVLCKTMQLHKHGSSCSQNGCIGSCRGVPSLWTTVRTNAGTLLFFRVLLAVAVA
jgi:hypothetical protein